MNHPDPLHPADARPVVAHLHRAYLALSETFIYQYLTHLHRYRPIMLARRTENRANFPFEPVYAVADQARLVQGWNYLALKAWGHQPYFLKILRQQKPALLHAHFGPEGVNALSLRRALNVPLVTVFYGKDMSQLPRMASWRRAYQRLFSEGDGFLVEGSHMKRELAALGCPEQKIHLSHIGVDTTKFSFKPRTLAPHEPCRLLMCGRLVEKKGVAYALEALAKVIDEFPNAQLRVVGDGPLRAELEALIRTRNLSAHAHILGYLSHDEYAREVENAHLFLVPSVRAADGDSEGGAPTVVLEAQAAGLPILGSTHADIPEVVGVKEPGFLVPERDADALARNLRVMLANPHRWPEWGMVGRKHVEAEYDIRRVAQTLETIYDRAQETFQPRK
ncbi:MAG: glycosyltransferase [Anaerolineales bacterium]|nr:glycosyltransferase [Anaerolineales bacterium]